MIVYLWDAPGPAYRGRGISGSLAAALEAAGVCVASGRASSARVEAARLGTCARTLEPRYERTGQAWLARRAESGRIRWEPAPPAQVPCSALAASGPEVRS